MNSQEQYAESMRRFYEQKELERQRMLFEAVYSPTQSRQSAGGAGSGAAGGNPDSAQLTPFILQSWGIGEFPDWNLYRLKTDGSKVLVENAPPLEGPTVFSKNTQDGLHYFVTYNMSTEIANFGSWNSLTSEWQFLEEIEGELLRNLVPASLQYIEGNEVDGNYFIYTDNCQYLSGIGTSTSDIAPKTFRIEVSDIPNTCVLTELHEWEVPSEIGSFPISTFYQLPVAIGAIPPQNLFQVKQYGTSIIDGLTLSVLSLINGDTYETIESDIMTINGLSDPSAKIAFVLDRTDYNDEIYFNIMVNDKINDSIVWYIAKFDPNLDTSDLTSIYQYSWDNNPYITLTTI